jgi:hypothetical protein
VGISVEVKANAMFIYHYNTLINHLNLGLWSKKLHTFTELGTFCALIFKIIFATHFIVRLIDSIEVKTALLLRYFNFNSNM